MTLIEFTEFYERLCRLFGRSGRPQQCEEWFGFLPKDTTMNELDYILRGIAEGKDRFPSWKDIYERLEKRAGDGPLIMHLCRNKLCSHGFMAVGTSYDIPIGLDHETNNIISTRVETETVYRCPVCRVAKNKHIPFYSGNLDLHTKEYIESEYREFSKIAIGMKESIAVKMF